jgi:hypothetical protein
MKKLTLDLDELRVESFDTAPALQNQRGTVNAYGSDWNCPPYTANTMGQSCFVESCAATCDCGYTERGTCGYTCGCDFTDLCSALC